MQSTLKLNLLVTFCRSRRPQQLNFSNALAFLLNKVVMRTLPIFLSLLNRPSLKIAISHVLIRIRSHLSRIWPRRFIRRQSDQTYCVLCFSKKNIAKVVPWLKPVLATFRRQQLTLEPKKVNHALKILAAMNRFN